MPIYYAAFMLMPPYSIKFHSQNAESLIGLMVSTALGMLLCAAAGHYLMSLSIVYHKMQQRFQDKHSWLIARHFIGEDLYLRATGVSSCRIQDGSCAELIKAQIPAVSDLLVLHTTSGKIIYYTRKSTISNATKYALYRDDLQHNAQAIAENIDDFKIRIAAVSDISYSVTVLLSIKNKVLELTCIF